MKRTLRQALSTVIIAAGFAVAAVYGQDDRAGGGGGRLEGTWDAIVTISDCTTGNVLARFPSIANFNQGGTSIGSTGGIPQSLRTPEHGVWRHVGSNIYRFKFKTFSFLPTGAPDGWTIVEHELELDRDNNSYTSTGTARFFAANGTFLRQGCSSGVGSRFEL